MTELIKLEAVPVTVGLTSFNLEKTSSSAFLLYNSSENPVNCEKRFNFMTDY